MTGVHFASIDQIPGKEQYKEQARAQLAAKAGASVRGSRAKQGGQVALVEAPEVARLHQEVCIRVTVFKQGYQWDADNIETKGICDALVANGILSNDRVKEVPVVIKHGESCKTTEEEKTVIEVYSMGVSTDDST